MKKLAILICLSILSVFAIAQEDTPPAERLEQTPTFRVNVVSRTTRAINYRHRGGSTTVDITGTSLMPDITGKAKVDSKNGRLQINVDLSKMGPPSRVGPQYLTYVLWAITPEGRPQNLGEIVPEGNGKASLEVTSDLQAFGLIVTAEPYFSVTRPSNEVVAENIIRQQTKGFEEAIDAKFDMLEGGQYTIDVNPDRLPSAAADAKTPLTLLEARNAVAIAKAAGAAKYAPDSLRKAEDYLARAEDYLLRKQGKTPIGTAARGATQMAEDARVLTLRRKEQERIANEKQAMMNSQQQAEAEARASAEAEAQARAQAEEDARRRSQAESDRAAAERAQAEAQQQQAQADAARAAAQADQQRAEAAAAEAIRQKEAQRQRLLDQLNQVLETKDTSRGLVVSMPDVLFDTGSYTLKPAARERLARISGIVLAYPDLRLEIEGHTDSVGSDSYNQTLSEKRAASVRDYLVNNGVSINNVIARGLGKGSPVADNSTAAGRKLNRRVEMIVSGDVIGTQITPGATTRPAPPPQ
jgi:outer membrane protein OmpA-like peptidoglycan-associated protein